MLYKGAILLAFSLAVAQAQTPDGGNNNGGQQQEQQQQQQEQQQQNQRQQQQQQSQIQPTIHLSGNVMLASGGAPAEPIRIIRVCGMQKVIEDYTNSDGHFSLLAGRNEQLSVTDASVGGQPTRGPFNRGGGDDWNNCSLEADAPGYRSTSISLWLMTGGNVGTIILTPLEETQGSVISFTSLAAPKKARASFFKAMNELGKGSAANRTKVMGRLQKALDEYPEYAAAWARLGQVRAETGDVDGAIAALEKSVKLDERYLLPYDALVRLYMSKGNWDHATELTRFVLGIHPADAAMRWYQAVCDYQTGHDDEAMTLLGEIQRDPETAKQFPKSHQIMGLIYARRGQISEAAAAYRLYLLLDPNAQAAGGIRKQLSEWGELGGL